MTKLSDALRGAADRAPVDGVSIHADVTARRVSRQRGMRGAANGLVGVGAVTLLAVGIMAPGMGGVADAPANAGKDGLRNDMATAEGAGDMMFTGYGMCGVYQSDYTWGEPYVELTAAIPGAEGTELDGGSTVDVVLTTTKLEDVALNSEPPAIYVLWDGMIVGQVPWEQFEASDFAMGNDVAGEVTVPLTLVNCWDGESLPGGKYEVVVNQSYFGAQTEPTPVDPEPRPIEPQPVDPTDSPSPEDGVASPDKPVDDTMFIGGSEIYFSVSASAGTIVVAGDVPEDPFGKYIPKQLTADDLPDNYLSPEAARELFLANVTNEPWNMAAGTSRWIMRANSQEPYDDTSWMRNYYGCVWDGSQSTSFPERSAELDLLKYTASIPSSMSVSYGWVVDGNPLINVTLQNTSDYAIPGIYGQPSAELYLVRDGRVVAEAYPANVDRSGNGGFWAEPALGGGVEAALASLGLLESGNSVSGAYLWREVNGCWNEQNGQLPVAAGTYTVLAAQSLYITSGIESYYYGGVFDGATMEKVVPFEGSGSDQAMSEPAIMPAPDWGTFQTTDLQMWTSLGTVTITN
ncbi:MAG: hypothetical protein CVT64_00540 [Actinobacteria bacterium HGW-Actinobacteria-4]|nr:MAG: hypothetical protein CVT64_00540 [Actinobacteria bacterium HGW-Actinobacteria-4]